MKQEKFINLRTIRPGKSAQVSSAVNKNTGRNVFLKQYPIIDSDTSSALNEPQLLTRLEHDNLAKIYTADVESGEHVLIEMELLTGGSFRDLISQASASGAWPSIYECIRLVSDVASGLSHLTAKGFVHRDVKPANLLIRINNERKQGVVADLGLVAKLNESGRVFSTKHSRLYRPPEVWEGRGYSAASDVYQLGMVLFQLLGGYLNHDLKESDDVTLASLASNGRLISIDTLAADVGPDLRKVIKTSISSEDKRFTSMSEFLVHLNSAKLKELDWSFKRTATGYILSRNDKSYSYTIEIIRKDNQVHVYRFKGPLGGKLRQKNPHLVFNSEKFETSKSFREILIW